jgi:DNA-binding winged helix-turn-helix (wHTH) protein/pimeloyl-ACP methyl ester carboxylesterase
MSTTADRLFTFQGFVLDPRERSLWHGRKKVALRARAFAILSILVENSGDLVEKQVFFDRVWEGLAISEEVLKVAMRDVRLALGDNAKAPRFIETVAKGGYRFIAPVTRTERTTSVEPKIRYARSGSLRIAYGVWGSGPIDIVLVPGWISHLELQWGHPLPAEFLTQLGRLARVISFDKPGTGLSDHIQGSPPLEERMLDVLAVMDAQGCEEAVLFGISEAAAMCALFAATYPERTRGLVIYGGTARAVNKPGYDAGLPREMLDGACAMMMDHWGEPLFVEAEAPSAAADPTFRDWWAKFLRSSASPGNASALLQMNAAIDITDVLPAIRVPTLVLHRKSDRMMPLAGARFLAERIAGANLVALEGEDHLPFVGPNKDLFDALELFLDTEASTARPASGLRTVLRCRLDSGDQLAQLTPILEQQAARLGGKLSQRTPEIVVAFGSTRAALQCATSLANDPRELRMLIDFASEAEEASLVLGAHDLSRLEPKAVHATARVVDVSSCLGFDFIEVPAVPAMYRAQATATDVA